mmetsp:Transcript_36421/g.67829  ORF Transcript_36421/g.67829 Transcript_36421/m.67829 type:complete len:264 (+) Transcript_36421:115-906(+)|eukprot:CAMPEP_0114419792 /NCGR_PEP_ID=MMETSP0103-20121206/4217_1 /TAXON_ID=37642 ORGANISM="Paraphysomonas imperforata, Strain PA2" /NCGR_SAMPLE_ID=MMETSP0103 /ASSEMBLY_ACC=CAM_ASM_000201 /LENGTH=263 /DNA_ID=CAMNT_0001588237 /DNA_START=85 /DNA_END=876 /DNA_ORIENTATION=+
MLDTWTKEEGTEMIEIGAEVFVLIVIFTLGILAAVMWFWPHLTPSIKSRFVKLLPCCFSLEETSDLLGSSQHSEMSLSSTHSTTPFTSASYEEKPTSSPFAHSQSVAPAREPEDREYAPSSSRRPLQRSIPPPHSSTSTSTDHPHQRYAPNTTPNPNPTPPPATRPDRLSTPPQYVNQAPPFVDIKSHNKVQRSPQPLQQLKVNPPPPVPHTQPTASTHNTPQMTVTQPRESRGGKAVMTQKTYQSRGSSRGSSSAHQYTRNL